MCTKPCPGLAEVIAGEKYICYDIDVTSVGFPVLTVRSVGCGFVTYPNIM